MSARAARRIHTVAALALFLAACTTPSSTGSAPASGTAEPARVLPSPNPDASPLAAGRWQSARLLPTATFATQADTWTAPIDAAGFLFLRARVPGVRASDIAALAIAPVDEVFVDPCEDGSAGPVRPWAAEDDPTAFFDWLDETSPVDWGEPATGTVAGYEALTVERDVPAGAYGSCVEGHFPMTDVGVEPPGQLGLPPEGQRFRLSALDVDGRTIVLLAFASTPELFADFSPIHDSLLSTLAFAE